MKLLDSLYSIVSESAGDSCHSYLIRLNADHFIYRAHFPGEPITPGVCIMQTALELTSLACGLELELSNVKHIKFLKVISPNEVKLITYSLSKLLVEEDEVKVQVSVGVEEEIYAKLSLVCKRKA